MNTRIHLRCWLAIYSACLFFACSTAHSQQTVAPPSACEPVPSARQLAWQENELTMFVHFGMNTFTGRSIGTGKEDPDQFNPDELDCSQWAAIAKECGFKGIILTAKHHDGFCLWPTASTKHSVAYSKWRDGKGDVVREASQACAKVGIKFGMYCSPLDLNSPLYTSDPTAYSKIYQQQLTELMSNYGPIFEMWFDGNRASVAEWPDVIRIVRTLQPGAVIKQGPLVSPIREDIGWIGNSDALLARLTQWSVYPPPNVKSKTERIWFPRECDLPMVGNWFWNDKPPMSLDELLTLCYRSVGRNSLLLLNVAPDRHGRFSDQSVARLREFHTALDKIFGSDFALKKSAQATNVRGNNPKFAAEKAVDGEHDTYWATDDDVTSASLEVDLAAPQAFNVVRTEEMIALGQRVSKYKIEAQIDGTWKEIASGTTIGYRKLDRFPKVTAGKVRLTIEEARACPALKSFGVHLDSISKPEDFEPAIALAESKRPQRASETTAPGAQQEFEGGK